MYVSVTNTVLWLIGRNNYYTQFDHFQHLLAEKKRSALFSILYAKHKKIILNV